MSSSSENMDSSGEGYGTLLFFRKDGSHSISYPLSEGQNTVGSSSDADIRLKINDDCLEKIHCIFDVNENGIATIINKSAKAPIKVNGVLIRKYKVLNDKDTVDIVGKKCQYLNENVSIDEVKLNERILSKKFLTPSSLRRRTIAPQLQGRSSDKKSPNLRTKTPSQVQKVSLKRKSEGAGVENISSVTPEKRPDQRSLSEKSKTTSKLVVSKALGAKANTTKRRLSLGNGPRRPNNNVSARVSARNIQFNKNTVTSLITEHEERPSLSMKQFSTPLNKKLESVKSSSRRSSIKKSLSSGDDLMRFDSPRKSILKNTPRKSILGVEENISDLLTKTVSFSNVKVQDNDKDDKKSLSKKNSGNRSGILYSDETEHLRLSSVSSLGSYPSQESLFLSSDTESPKKSVSRLSLRKSMESQIEMSPSRKSRLSLAKTRISSRNFLNIPKETTPDITSEGKYTSDEINKTDSSDESINLQLSASSSSSEPHSTRNIKDLTENIPTLKQRNSMLGRVSTELGRGRGIESQDSEVSSSNSSQERDLTTQYGDNAEKDDSVIDQVNEKCSISTRKSSLRRNDTLHDSLDEGSLAEELPLSPIHPVRRRSSTRKSSISKISSGTTEYNLQASVRKSNKSIEQDEENESEDHQYSQSDLKSSFEDVDTPSYYDNNKSVSNSEKNRSSRYNKSSSTSRIQNASILSSNDETPETNRRPSLRNSWQSLVDNLDSESQTSFGINRKSSSDNSQENLNPELETTSPVQTPQHKRKSSIKHRESSDSVLQENLTTSLGNTSELQNRSMKSRKSSLGRQQDLVLPLARTTPVPRSRSAGRARTSLVNHVEEDLTLPVDQELLDPDNVSKPSLGSLRQEKTLPLEGKTPVPRNRSSVKSRKSQVDDLQENLTVPMEYEMPESDDESFRKYSTNNLYENSTLPMEDETPNSKTESFRRSGKSSLGTLQEDCVILSPVQSKRSSVKSRKSSVNDLNEDSTLPMEDELPNSMTEFSRTRKSSLGALQEDSVRLSEGQLPVPRNRSSVKSRKSLVNDLHEDLTLSMEDDTPKSNTESSRRNRKSSLGALQENLVIPSPVPRNRSSVKSRKSSVNQPMENETPNSKINLSRKSRKSSFGNLQHCSVLAFEGQSPAPRNRSSIKSRKSSVHGLHDDSMLPVEYEMTDSENELFKQSRKSALGGLHQDSTLSLERQTPVPRNRSLIKSRKSSVNDLLENSTLPLEEQTPIPRNRSSVKHINVSGLHENSTLPLEFQQDLVVTLDNRTPRSSIKTKNSLIHHTSEGTPQPLEDGTPKPSRRSSRTPKPSLRYSVKHLNQYLANESDASVVCLETSISSVRSKPLLVSDDEDSVVPTPEKSAAEKFQMSTIGHASQTSSSNLNKSSVNAKTPVPYRRSVRRSSKEDSYTISLAHSTLHEGHSSLYDEFSIEDSRAETPESIRRSSARRNNFDKSIDSDNLNATQEPLESWTPGKGIRSSRRSKKSSEDIYGDESHLSMRSQTPDAKEVHSVRSSTAKKDISVADTLDGTPENNTSIVFIDTPLDESRKPGCLRLSKTIRSQIEEVDLTTPKSAIKSRRRKSLPYRPETEDITPVSPLDQNESETETGFKTPLTTPGLFEDIRKSVLKSRSRMQKSSSSFMEELSKAKSAKKASKRPRESNGDSGRQHKRRKLVIDENDSFESYDGSFESFQSEEALTDISASNISQDTPSHFSDLTDKPVITHPRTRFSTGNKLNKRKSTRRSLPVSSTMMVHTSGSNTADEENSEERLNESSEEVKWVQKSPEKDLTNIAGVKRLMKTPRVQNSPKNDLSDVRGIKKLLSTPREVKSPKNDLTNIIGVKKLLATPKEIKSPKNDLTNIPNLRRIMSPKYQNSPVNDLSDLRGVKKLLGTPKELKDPRNELSDLEGVAEIFNMSGVHRLSTNSDIENNEDMFGQLIVRRPLKTYRGKSLSPIKAIDSYGAKRKTMGDKTVTSPRVEDWVKEQAVIRIKRLDDLAAGDGPNESNLEKGVEEPSTQSKKKTRVQEIKEEIVIASPPRRGGRRKAAAGEESESSKATTRTQNKVDASTPTESPVRKTTRGKSKKVVEKIGVSSESEETDFTKEVKSLAASEGMEENAVESPRPTRGRRNKVKASTPTASPARKATRGKSKKVIEEIGVQNEPKESEITKDVESLAASECTKENAVESLKPTRGRRNKVEASTTTASPARKATRGRSKKVIEEISVQNEPKETEIGEDVESLAASEGTEEQSVETRTIRGGKNADVLEEKPTRGRRKGANQIENPKETEEVENIIVAKTAKGKKKNIGEEKSEVASVESPKKTRGRRKVKESPVVEKTRGKKKVIIDEDQSKEIVVALGESPLTMSREKQKITVEVPVKAKVTKGRKKTVEEPEDALEKSEEDDVVFVDSPKIATRGRRNAKVIEEVIVEKPTRGRRKVGGKEKIIEESSDDALCESSETIEFKKPVSGKNTDISDESELSVVDEKDMNEISKKNPRGAKKIQKLQDVFVESPKTARGRRKVLEEVESTVDDTEESTKKTRKGRNLRTVQAEDSKELLVSSTNIKKPTSKSSKVAEIENEISSTQVDSTTGDFPPMQSEDSNEENIPKPIKGKKTRRNVEIEADIKLDEKPVLKRTKRGRKVSSDEALNAMETRTELEEVENKKVTKPKSKKVTTKIDSVEDSENSRPTRGGRKKQTKKQAEEEDIEIVEVTRNSRRKESEDITEEPPKKITRKNENAKERVGEASIGNTKKTGRVAKNKAVAKIAEEEVNSPKTRSVKGNFNKYGSSFETESPGKAVGRRKRVHFD